MNDPGLITLVNKLQDVFTTVGVRIYKGETEETLMLTHILIGAKSYRSSSDSSRWLAIKRKEFRIGEHSWARLVSYCI